MPVAAYVDNFNLMIVRKIFVTYFAKVFNGIR